MELRDWVDGTNYALGQYTSVIDMADDDWQLWGMFFFNNPQLVILGPPNPYEFSDWEPWAERLADAINNAGQSSSGPPPIPPITNGKLLITFSGNFIETASGQFLTTFS